MPVSDKEALAPDPVTQEAAKTLAAENALLRQQIENAKLRAQLEEAEQASPMPTQQVQWKQQQQQQQQLLQLSKVAASPLGGYQVGLDGVPTIPGGRSQLQAPQGATVFESCQAQVNLWQSMEIDPNLIARGVQLAQGVHTEVYEGRVRGFHCAIKVHRKTAPAQQLQRAMSEIRLAASLDHPCTLRLIGWARNPPQTLTELCLGDLNKFYTGKIGEVPFNERKALQLLEVGLSSSILPSDVERSRESLLIVIIITHHHHHYRHCHQQTASGILYLHSVSIIHRDIKPENVLICAGKGNTAKIANYGTSRIVDRNATMSMRGTPIYMAPEILRGERYSFAADVYSFGLTVYAVCNRVSMYALCDYLILSFHITLSLILTRFSLRSGTSLWHSGAPANRYWH